MFIPSCIVIFLQLVNIPIYFNDQCFCMAIKINNVTVDNLLTAKLKSFQTIMAQFLPRNSFRRSHIAPQLLGAFVQFSRNLLTKSNIIYLTGGKTASSSPA